MRRDEAFQAEQRMLGVGVPVVRKTRAHLRHVPRLNAHSAALARGFADPDHDVAPRLERLRARLWRSPLCVRWLRDHGHAPDDLQSLADLAHLPTMDRETLGRGHLDAPALGLDALAESELSIAISSGSTGQAVPVFRDGYDALHMWAVIRFWLGHARVELPPRPRLVLLDALPGGLEYSTRLPHFDDGALHRVSTLKPEPARRLAKARADILSSDPAGFHWLSGCDADIHPRMSMSSAQYLPPAQRAEVEARFSAPLFNYYATTEAGPIAWECLATPGVFHALQPDVHVESLEGELVVTRLRDSVLPLLRHRTGDRGEVRDGACACGFRGRSIVGFTGRRACLFVRPDGARVDAWNLIWLFKDLPLVGFRMTQLEPETFVLQVDRPLPMAEDLLAKRLETTLERLGWARAAVRVETVAALPKLAKPAPFATEC